MKKIVKLGSITLCFTLITIMMVGCGNKTMKLGKGDMKFHVNTGEGYVAVADADISESKNIVTVKVAPGVTNVEIDFQKVISATEDIWGKDLSFTRSDMSGKGYAYERVEDNTKWRKLGTTELLDEAPNGLALYEGTDGKYIFYAFAEREADGTPKSTAFTTEGKTYEFKITGHNKKTYTLEVKIQAKAS